MQRSRVTRGSLTSPCNGRQQSVPTERPPSLQCQIIPWSNMGSRSSAYSDSHQLSCIQCLMCVSHVDTSITGLSPQRSYLTTARCDTASDHARCCLRGTFKPSLRSNQSQCKQCIHLAQSAGTTGTTVARVFCTAFGPFP